MDQVSDVKSRDNIISTSDGRSKNEGMYESIDGMGKGRSRKIIPPSDYAVFNRNCRINSVGRQNATTVISAQCDE